MVHPAQRGFTLVELLVILAIVAMVSAMVIAGVVWTMGERHIVAGASQVQAAIVAARDLASRTGELAGFRLLPDEAFPLGRLADGTIDPGLPLASSAWVPLETPPAYREGLVAIHPYTVVNPFPLPLPSPVLVLEECPIESWQRDATGAWTPLTATPTAWWYNARIGERIRIGAGPEYTIVGPMVIAPAAGNAEAATNIGPAGTVSPLVRTFTCPDGSSSVQRACEYLFLVNGRDDNHDGFIDNGYDGVTERFAPGVFEVESWEPGLAQGVTGAAYRLLRRPAVSPTAPVHRLPSTAVIDLTGWSTSRLRSRLPIDPYTGAVDVLVTASGQYVPTQVYSNPASAGIETSWLHFWVGERAGVGLDQPEGEARLVTFNGRSGRIGILDPWSSSHPFQDAMHGAGGDTR